MKIYSNTNVRWILLSSTFFSVASSIFWFTPTWLVYALGGTNADLGLILGVGTLSSIFISLSSSIIADRYRRDILIWIGASISVIGMYSLSLSQNLDHILLFVILTVSGNAILGPAVTGLLANSIKASDRNRVYGTQFLLTTGSGVIGNLLNYFLFLDIGQEIAEINPDLLRFSLKIGTVFGLFAVIFSFFIHDSQSLSEEEEDSIATRHSEGQMGIREQFAPGAIPVLLISTVSGIFIGFGAGTSVPYFPRFFFDIYSLDLSNLSLVFAGLTVITAVWGKINSNLADRFGRVQLIVVNQLLAVSLLYILAFYPPLLLALMTLFVRNAVMNGAWPLNNAILMEFSPRKFRSLTIAITQVTWSLMFGFGQIFGGQLVDTVGFRAPFTITATLYLISTLIFWQIRKYDRKPEISINPGVNIAPSPIDD